MMMNATEFKAKCLALLDRVQARRETVTITKHGRIVAKLVPESDASRKPWLRLRGKQATWHGDPLAPALPPNEIQALK